MFIQLMIRYYSYNNLQINKCICKFTNGYMSYQFENYLKISVSVINKCKIKAFDMLKINCDANTQMKAVFNNHV